MPNSPLLKQVISKSQESIGLITFAHSLELPENQTLKHFVLWTLITRTNDKEIECNHKVHANWPADHEESMKVLSRLLLVTMIRRIGIRQVEEILTDLRLGGINDTEDNIN